MGNKKIRIKNMVLSFIALFAYSEGVYCADCDKLYPKCQVPAGFCEAREKIKKDCLDLAAKEKKAEDQKWLLGFFENEKQKLLSSPCVDSPNFCDQGSRLNFAAHPSFDFYKTCEELNKQLSPSLVVAKRKCYAETLELAKVDPCLAPRIVQCPKIVEEASQCGPFYLAAQELCDSEKLKIKNEINIFSCFFDDQNFENVMRSSIRKFYCEVRAAKGE